MTVAELRFGVKLADGRRREHRERFVAAILAAIPVETYDLEVAEAHAELLVDARRAGRPRGPHDLIIAATAVALRPPRGAGSYPWGMPIRDGRLAERGSDS